MTDTPSTLKDIILEEISSGNTKMRPRSYFVMRTSLLALGTAVATLTLLYTISLIFFVTELNGSSEIPAFGLRGITPFILALPWLLILTSLAALVLLELLVQRYAFAYRKPLTYSLLGVMVLAVLGGMLVTKLRLHQQLFRFAEQERLPIAGPFYRQYDRQHSKTIYPGIIAELRSDGFYLTTRQAKTYTVLVTQETLIPQGFVLRRGEVVVVLGQETDKSITALGVRPWYSEMGKFEPK